jgi:glycosyltransferase involved in cell wall biosynthesis
MQRNRQVLSLLDMPPPFGGVRVSARMMMFDLVRIGGIDFVTHLFDSNPKALLFALWDFMLAVTKADGVLFQIGDVLTLIRKRGIAYWLAVSVQAKPKIFRGFAGGLSRQYELLPWYKRWLLRKVLGSFDLVTFQTKFDADYFSKLLASGPNKVRWLPNVRSPRCTKIPDRALARRFCFIGKVYRPKGAHHIVAAAASLPSGVTIDIYGPIEPHEAEDIGLGSLSEGGSVRYCGTVEPDRVPDVLMQYDTLLVPTTWKTEGHPGVILEAFSVGVPVIATRWNGIPEIVDETCGILVEIDSTQAVLDAIRCMHEDSEMWQAMRRGALTRLKEFDPDVWTRSFHGWILETVK